VADQPSHPPLEDWLNADPPPEFIDALDVELVSLTIAGGPAGLDQFPPRVPMTFQFERDDHTQLIYGRCLNDDGRVGYRLRGSSPA
jgi:hypothetical protein